MPNKTAKDAPSTLPEGAARIWAGAFNAAYDGTCKDEGERRDECAAKVAWAAVKKKYKRSGKTWVKKSETNTPWEELSLNELESNYNADFIVTKTSSADGELRWVGRASDTFEDNLGTRMTKTLFMNFMRRSEFYGMPYLGVAHYGALGGRGIAGPTQQLWIDGAMFKASGKFAQNSLGLALYGALNTERSAPDLDPDSKIRLSLGFLDLKHTHGDYAFERESLYDVCPICELGELPDTFLDGVILHFAATRVPINTRTDLEIEEGAAVMRSDAVIKTRREDAASIVGEDLAQELEALSLAMVSDPDSEFSDAAVRMSDSQTEVEEPGTENKIEEETKMAGQTTPVEDKEPVTGEPEQDDTEQAPETEVPTDNDTETPTTDLAPPTVEGSQTAAVSKSMEPIQQTLTTFSEGVLGVLGQSELSRDERLAQLQDLLNGVAVGLKDGAERITQDPQAQLVAAFSEAVRTEMAPVVEGLQQLVVVLSAAPVQTAGRKTHSMVPQIQQSQTNQPQSQFRTLARRSTGLDKVTE